MQKKIVLTGGSGRFAQVLKNSIIMKKFFILQKNLNIEKFDSIKKYIKKLNQIT